MHLHAIQSGDEIAETQAKAVNRPWRVCVAVIFGWIALACHCYAGRMHTLNFRDVLEIQPWEDLTKRAYASDKIAEVAKAYEVNIRRAHGIALVPGHAFMDGENFKVACSRAMVELNTDDPRNPTIPDLAVKYYQEREESFSVQDKCDHFREATGNADAMWEQFDTMPQALHGLLQTMVIQAWTAFEVVVEDLWKAAVGEHPSLVAAVPAEKRHNVFKFRSRKAFRASYEKTFQTDDSHIRSILGGSDIDALALVRNVLVHLAGKTDNEFKDQSKGIVKLAVWQVAPGNTEIEFTGAFTRELIDPVTPIGFTLIQEVDAWLKRNA